MSGHASEWRPRAGLDVLAKRAAGLAAVRAFFGARGLMETETPLLVPRPVSDPQLANVRCELTLQPGRSWYLHTSPEYHMKRLLAAGAPDIFQVCKVFRDGEAGPRHLTEFTMVEWYRRGFSFDAMIAETCDLVAAVGAAMGRTLPAPRRLSYREAFVRAADVDPVTDATGTIRDRALVLLGARLGSGVADALGERREAWLDLLMVEIVEPALAGEGLVALERFPARQAALARLDPVDPRLAERFEIYLHGLELANGFRELLDAREQQRRFEADRADRRSRGLPDVPPDPDLLAALQSGLPDCCGVALGFDRLLMACLGMGRIEEVVSFLEAAYG